MNKHFIIIATAIFFIGNICAHAFPVKFNGKAERYSQKIRNHTWAGHRSGVNEDEEGVFGKTAIADPEFSLLSDEQDNTNHHEKVIAQANRTDEYNIIFEDSNKKFDKYIAKKFPAGLFTVSYDAYFHEYKIIPTTLNNAKEPLLTQEQLRLESEKIARKYLGFFKNKIEFDNYRLDYANQTIEKAAFLYRRIFKGGLVYLSLSNIEITLNANGSLDQITIKWPIFKKANTMYAGTPVDIEVANQAAITEIQTNQDTVSAFDGSDPQHAQKAEITGMALSWVPANLSDGTSLLTPCYSYLTKIQYNDSLELNPVIEVPVLSKYYK